MASTPSVVRRNMPVRVLLLFGVVGLVLSEVLGWNVGPVVAAASRGPVNVGLTLVIAVLGYTLMFAVVLDLAHRWGVSDWPGVVLAGSIYGLINEGVFGETVFLPGFGPRLLGLWPVRMAFPALSWHPLIDFALGVLVVLGLCRGGSTVSKRRLGAGDAFAAVAVGVAFAATSRLPWVRQALGGAELPAWVQALALVVGALLVGGALLIAPRGPADAEVVEVLGRRARIAAWAVVAAALVARFVALPVKIAVVPFLAVVAAHLLALRLHVGARRPRFDSPTSILRPCASVRSRPDPIKLASLAAIAGASYVAVRAFTSFPPLQALARSAGFLLIVAATAFAVLFPVVVTVRALVVRRRQRSGS
jgi:hypothetical protein